MPVANLAEGSQMTPIRGQIARCQIPLSAAGTRRAAPRGGRPNRVFRPATKPDKPFILKGAYHYAPVTLKYKPASKPVKDWSNLILWTWTKW
jgi:hypothetical protein